MTTKFNVENLGPGGRYAVERLADVAEITSTSRVLEIGSGHGLAAIHLAETRQCHVVATDCDMEKLERLQRRVLALDLEGLIDAAPLNCTTPWPHSSDSFDVVIAGSVLDRTDFMDTPVQEAFRVLRPGGHFAIYGAVFKRESRDDMLMRVLGKEIQSLADYELLLTTAHFRIAASRMLPDHLWADYYRQFIEALEHEQVDAPDIGQPWGWYEEAAIVLTHLDVVGVGLVIGRKDIEDETPPPELQAAEAVSMAEAMHLPEVVETLR